MTKKRKICFVITSFIHYSRSFLILEELSKRPEVDLHIVIAGTALLPKYSASYARVKNLLTADGFRNIHEIYFNLEGDSHIIKAKSAGLGIVEFAAIFNDLKPHLVVVRGDRFEVLSAATAASYLNIPIAHIEGGDLSGSIDESVRHAVTKLSHIHFVTNESAYRRVLSMGEDKRYVFNFGSPEGEIIDKVLRSKHQPNIHPTGSGFSIDLKRPYVIVMYHPVVTENDGLGQHTRIVLGAVHGLAMQMQTFWFWPNFDAGAESIASVLRSFNDQVKEHKIRFMRYIPPRDFLWLLKEARCLVGNSSAGIKECSYLGVPVVNLGTRQNNRLRAENVVDCHYDKTAIQRAIKRQIKVGRYPASKLYRGQNTSKKIARVLATIPLYVQKKFIA